MADNDDTEQPTDKEPKTENRRKSGFQMAEPFDLDDVEPRKTGDPELDALWEMNILELREIVDDEDNPLHDKALTVQREIMKPLTDAMEEITRGVVAPLTDSVRTSVFKTIPTIDTTSWFASIVPKNLYKSIVAPRPLGPKFGARINANLGSSFRSVAFPARKASDQLDRTSPRVVDFQQIEVPDISAAETATAVQIATEQLAEIRRSNDLLNNLIASNAQSAAESAAARREARWANILAALAVLVAIGSLTLQFLRW